jgi:hypothetical protein
LPFRADHADAHSASLYLLANRWAEAGEAVLRISSWRRIPVPLSWMAQARYQIDGMDASWPLLVELAWLSPSLFDPLLERLDDVSLVAMRRSFDASFDGEGGIGDLAWFPAWVLTEKPGLAPLFRQAESTRHNAPERAFRLVLAQSGASGSPSRNAANAARTAVAWRGGVAAYMKTR